MKILKANFSMIALAWQGSKAWVICTMIDIIINPLRNLMIDVLLIGYLYNAIEKGREFSSLFPLFAVLLIFYTANLIFEAVFIGRLEPVGEIKIQKYVDQYLCEHTAKVGVECYDNPQFYEKYIFSMENGTDIAKKAVTNTANFIAYGLGGLMSIGLITNIEPFMIVFIVLSIVFSLIISNYRKKTDLKYSEQVAGIKHKEDYVHKVFYMKEYAKELRAFPELAELNLDFFAKAEKEKHILMKQYGRRKWIGSVLDILNSRTVMYWLVMLLTIGTISMRGNIAPGNLLIMTVSIATAALLINALAWAIPEMYNIARYHEKFLEFLSSAGEDLEPKKKGKGTGECVEEKNKRKYPAQKSLNGRIESIQFEHVFFTYPGEKSETLKDISFKADIGNPVVIVGENGAGKSTIFKLILKFYSPDRGRILVNGMDLSEIDTDGYRKMIGCVFQNVNMYAMSLKKNIVVSDVEAESQKMRRAIEKSGLANSFAKEEMLEKELTKEFRSDGIVFSGGNMQKIAIARAFYQDVSMLLLDEMTSALDPETELKIMDSVKELGAGRVTVMISHKLSCVKQAAQILFLKDGHVCEAGNHAELMEKQGYYYQLFRYQSEKFEKEKRRSTLEGEAWL